MNQDSVYLDFYGMSEKPFTLSPDPKFLYYSPSHKEAISQFIYAVYEQAGFMVLTGEVGTGKTTLVNALLKHLPERYLTVCIKHKIFNTRGLIQNICKELKIDILNYSTSELIILLQNKLHENNNAGLKTILIIDEAQNLELEILEDIRLLSNFEAPDEKYLHILMVGQPEFDVKLADTRLRQLNERITLRYKLKNLDYQETANYVRHRLKVAGYNSHADLFTNNALNTLYQNCGGIPRRINRLCQKALLMGYVKNAKSINEEIIKSIAFDILDEMDEIPQPGNLRSNVNNSNGESYQKNGDSRIRAGINHSKDAHEFSRFANESSVNDSTNSDKLKSESYDFHSEKEFQAADRHNNTILENKINNLLTKSTINTKQENKTEKINAIFSESETQKKSLFSNLRGTISQESQMVESNKSPDSNTNAKQFIPNRNYSNNSNSGYQSQPINRFGVNFNNNGDRIANSNYDLNSIENNHISSISDEVSSKSVQFVQNRRSSMNWQLILLLGSITIFMIALFFYLIK